MCGIIGYVSLDKNINWEAACKIQNHRGPDAAGSYENKQEGYVVALGHQRLKILDLSDDANQPIRDDNNKKILVFNGEIYNYKELNCLLSKEIQIHNINSDTKTLFAMIQNFGIEKTLHLIDGMWAFCVYDIDEKMLILCRDRFGEKPLYYTFEDNSFYFSSEIKALLKLTNKKYKINRSNSVNYLVNGHLDRDDKTFFENIFQVEAGSILKLNLHNRLSLKKKKYYSISQANPNHKKINENVEIFRTMLLSNIKLRSRSDVPVGILLSGGLDSSAIAAFSKKIDTFKFSCFSLKSENQKIDESRFSEKVAKFLGIELKTVTLASQPEDLLDQLEECTWFMDAPLLDFSNIAHFNLMRCAGQSGIKVLLSGQGADEIFCGYRKYLGFALHELLNQQKLFDAISLLGGFALNQTILTQFQISEAKRYFKKNPAANQFFQNENQKQKYVEDLSFKKSETLIQKQIDDLVKFSVPTLCHYEDRMSMAQAKEIRLPFLDHKIVEFGISLPLDNKLHRGWTKFILRKAVESMLPPEIVWRKDKQGFINDGEILMKTVLKQKILNHMNKNAIIFTSGIVTREQFLFLFNEFCNKKSGFSLVSKGEVFRLLAFEKFLKVFLPYLDLGHP